MKRILFAVLAVFAALNLLGYSAAVSPSKIGVNTQQNFFEITVYGCVTDGAAFEFSIPAGFNAAPDLNGTVPGAVSAVVMRNGTTPEGISNINMSVNGLQVKINNISLSANDSLIFTYGKVDVASGLYGITAPSNPSELLFGVRYSTDNWSTFIEADTAPKVRILFMDMIKSVSVPNIMAGMTFTYTITYSNMSPYHYAQNLRVWDSLPQGVEYVSQSSVPAAAASASGNVITFEPGTLMYQQSGVINMVVRSQPGIVNFGSEAVNRAALSGSDMYSNTLSAYAEAKADVSGIKYETSLAASPSSAAADTVITVILNAKNTGNAAGANIQPGVLNASPAAAVEYISGPSPAYYSYFGTGEAKTFTWTYKAVQPGSVYFTGSVSAGETYAAAEKTGIISNAVSVFMPTPTPGEPTPVPSVTVEAAPNATPEAKTDKNYFNPDKNEKVTVYFSIKKAGRVSVKVANLNGEKIREFEINTPAAGVYSQEWDGRNESGKAAAKGMYFVVIKQESGTEMVRVAVIK